MCKCQTIFSGLQNSKLRFCWSLRFCFGGEIPKTTQGLHKTVGTLIAQADRCVNGRYILGHPWVTMVLTIFISLPSVSLVAIQIYISMDIYTWSVGLHTNDDNYIDSRPRGLRIECGRTTPAPTFITSNCTRLSELKNKIYDSVNCLMTFPPTLHAIILLHT